jgi:dipeptidyl aminopeptidase/acylaminoacyl peptidase
MLMVTPKPRLRNQPLLKSLSLLGFYLFIISPWLYAAQVTEKLGNIYYDNGQGQLQQLTDSGKDSQPAVSPDGKQVVFVRKTANQETELWLMDSAGDHAHAIVLHHEDMDSKKNLTEINNPLFALDGKAVYFQTFAWVTSNAIHRLDLASNKQQFVTDGNSLELVPSGKYQDYLIVSKHKYYKHQDGSYEDYCLVSPKGKELKSLGTGRYVK